MRSNAAALPPWVALWCRTIDWNAGLRGAWIISSGAEYILREAGFPRPCDFVVTGEGCIDRTSLGGKVVGTVLKLSPAPVVLVCGRCELKKVAFETGDRAPEALVRAARRAGEWIKGRLRSGR